MTDAERGPGGHGLADYLRTLEPLDRLEALYVICRALKRVRWRWTYKQRVPWQEAFRRGVELRREDETGPQPQQPKRKAG